MRLASSLYLCRPTLGATVALAGLGPPVAVRMPLSVGAVPPSVACAVWKDQFQQDIAVHALKVPTQKCSEYMKKFSRHLLNKPRLKNVKDVAGQPEWKLLLLGEEVRPEGELEVGGRTATLHALAHELGLTVTQAEVHVDYSYWPAGEVLKVASRQQQPPPSYVPALAQRLLPEGVEAPTAFETVGHVAHLNLRQELLPYKHLIGQVVLDKNPRLKTVVNKLGSIENEYRVFDMELLAGEASTKTEVRQHGLRFRLDFAKVYWNSRLEREHARLVEEHFRPGQVVLDVMAGIGPFAIPAAKKGCQVIANDLNPDSYAYLCENIELNKVAGQVVAFNMDGRELCRLACAGQLQLPPPRPARGARAQPNSTQAAEPGGIKCEDHGAQLAGSKGQAGHPAQASRPNPPFDHVVMNLPASAPEFLDAFTQSFDSDLWSGHDLPMVHVYAFIRADETVADLRRRMEAALGAQLPEPPAFFDVRDVAPNKRMYCASFRMPRGLALPPQQEQHKRQKSGASGP